MTFKTIAKVVIGAVVAMVALELGMETYFSYRYSNVSKIVVSRLPDLDRVFEAGDSNRKIKNPEFLVVCFSADYVYALESAQKWFAPGEAEFAPALSAAGGLADHFNDENTSSIVLLSHTSAVILELEKRKDFAVGNVGCASAADGIEIKKSRSDANGIEFWLPNSTLRSTRGK
jgi:hypothetical protein